MILRNGTIISMSGPDPAPRVADVAIDDGRIVSIGSGLPAPAGAEGIDLKGKFVIPGLIDTHAHVTFSGGLVHDELQLTQASRVIQAGRNALATLAAGITTVRDVGGIEDLDITLRDAIRTGHAFGPRIVASGRMIAMTGGHGWFYGEEADGPDAVRKAVRKRLKIRADWVKFMASGGFAEIGEQPGSVQLGLDELKVGIGEARNAGRKTAVHAHGAEAIKNAILAGADSIEHGSFLDDEVIDLMVEHKVTVVPTFSVYFKMLETGAQHGISADVIDSTRRWWDLKVERFVKAFQAGVRVAAGSDNGSPASPHPDITTELEVFVKIGLTPYQALRTATIQAAELLGLEDQIGTLEVGRAADVVALSEDPLRDVRATRAVDMVIQGGRVFRRSRAGGMSLPF